MSRFAPFAFAVVLAGCGDARTTKKPAPRTFEASVTTAVMLHATHVDPVVEEPRRVSERVHASRGEHAAAVSSPAHLPMNAMAVDESTIACTPHWKTLDLDRCIDGDADGCVGIGDEYATGACDAFSAIKWYRRGCRLGSPSACGALARLGEVVPPPPN